MSYVRRSDSVSKGDISAFAEDYQVTDLGKGRSRIDWVMAMGLPGEDVSGLGAWISAKVLGGFVRMTLWRFKRYVESGPTLATGHEDS
jgi:hypothetical protein